MKEKSIATKASSNCRFTLPRVLPAIICRRVELAEELQKDQADAAAWLGEAIAPRVLQLLYQALGAHHGHDHPCSQAGTGSLSHGSLRYELSKVLCHERPGLSAALAGVKQHGAGILLVATRDRLARDTLIAALVEQRAQQLGAAIRAVDGSGNTVSFRQ